MPKSFLPNSSLSLAALLATKKFMSFCAKVLKDQRNLAVRPGNCTAELRVAKTAKTTDALLKDKIILPHTY